jgi:CheY-like chemotaxis protein
MSAECGAEGICCLESHTDPVDLLLTDVVMPEMSGRELADRALVLHPEMRVICTSGYTGDVVFREGFLEHDAEFLPNPFTPRTLARRIRELLDG